MMKVKTKKEDKEKEEEEPLSPMARVLQSPGMNCYIVTKFGFKTKINPDDILNDLKLNVHKHPRFSSILSEDGKSWIKIKVNVTDHVTVPDIDLDEVGDNGEQFLEDYISHLTTLHLDRSKPLWDIHILNIKTCDAEAVCVVRTHHSLGDGMSFMSLIVACTEKTSNIEASPMKRRETTSYQGWWFLRKVRVIWNTIVDIMLSLATFVFLTDTETPLKGSVEFESNPKRFVHRIVSLDDIKLIKEAMSMTINDVLTGVTQAGISRYLNRLYDKTNEKGETSTSTSTSTPVSSNLPSRLRLRAVVFVNLRSSTGIQPLADMMTKDSKCKWGNYISTLLLPLSVGLETDPLVYLSKAKSAMDRKKNSLQASILYSIIKFAVDRLDDKVVGKLTKRALMNTTVLISNVVGPTEEISYHNNPIVYISPSVYGHPQALLIHFQSYAGKIIISMAVDVTVIPDPHQLCQDMEDSLKDMEDALLKRGLL